MRGEGSGGVQENAKMTYTHIEAENISAIKEIQDNGERTDQRQQEKRPSSRNNWKNSN